MNNRNHPGCLLRGSRIFEAAVAACAAMATIASAGELRYVADTAGNRAQPAVAVDNVCAWPNLTRLDDGTLVAALFNQPSHGRMVGDVDCWASTDGGHSWQRRGVVAPHDPALSNRMSRVVGLAANGDLVCVSGGWTLKWNNPANHAEGLEVDVLQRPWVCRSSDGGYTWQVDREAFPAKTPEGWTFTPFGDVARAHDGTLRMAAYGSDPAKRGWRQAYVLTSRDDGRTFGEPTPIDRSRTIGETYLFHAGDGRWLAVSRSSQLEQYESTDDGRTWRHMGSVTRPSEFPGHLQRLRDGRILLSYACRIEGDEHVAVKISDDEGKSWSDPIRVVDFITFDGGYADSIQIDDSRVITAYYARQTSYRDAYHMGRVIWDLNATFGK